MARQRLTRKLAEQGKKASPPPQIPAVDRTEGPASPAYYPDPDADKYQNGDTSSWAEDPHKPMEPESPPPAMPGNLTTEDLDHPATSDFQKKPETPEQAMDQGGGGGKQASLKELAEQRATLCVRLASAMLPKASALEVEERAVRLMDLDDVKLKAAMETFNVLAGEEPDDEKDEGKDFEKGEESEGTKLFDEGKEGGKKAAHEMTARLDRIEGALGRVVKAMGHFFGADDEEEGMSDKELMAYLMAEDMDGDGVDQNKADYAYSDEKAAMEEEMEEEEAMLRAMLEEMDDEMSVMAGKKADDDDDEDDEDDEDEHGKEASAATESTDPLAKGSDIQSGEGGNVNPDPAAHTPVVAQSDGKDKRANEDPTENDIEITAGADPMGLMETTASADDELIALYADLDLPKTAKKGGEEEEMDEEAKEAPMDDEAGTDEKAEKDDVEFGADDEKKGGKKARQRPQPKAASAGAQQLGNVAGMPKAAHDEIAELGKIWETAPDVASVFGLPSGS
jgi:hypothetical protein